MYTHHHTILGPCGYPWGPFGKCVDVSDTSLGSDGFVPGSGVDCTNRTNF
jgi:hypothetical protein